MAVTFNYADNATNGTTAAQTLSSPATAFTAGRRIVVIGGAERNNHTAGLDSAFSISDDATTNSITWTERHVSTILDNGNFDTQVKVWTSNELTDNETITITIDGNDAGTETFRCRMQICEFTGGDGTLALVDSDGSTVAAEPATDLGSAPSTGQLFVGMRWGGGGNTWDAEPANFTTPTGAEVDNTTLMESADNTDATVTFGRSTSAPTWFVHMAFTEAAVGGPPPSRRDPFKGLSLRH